MMKKIYYLSTCSTCSRIIKELNLGNDFEYQDIKSTKITEAQLEEMAKMSGSYESLFSRKAIKYRAMGLAEKTLTENDYKKLILEEYTFLKRPVIIVGNAIFVGNAKAVVDKANKVIGNK
jgi:arsenate reductase